MFPIHRPRKPRLRKPSSRPHHPTSRHPRRAIPHQTASASCSGAATRRGMGSRGIVERRRRPDPGAILGRTAISRPPARRTQKTSNLYCRRPWRRRLHLGPPKQAAGWELVQLLSSTPPTPPATCRQHGPGQQNSISICVVQPATAFMDGYDDMHESYVRYLGSARRVDPSAEIFG